MEPTQPNPTQENNADNPLHVMSPGEQIVCNIKRHPIGMLGIYIMSGILLLALFAGVAVLPQIATDLSSTDKTYAFITALALAALILVFTWIAMIIYRGNRWIVTTDSITQIQQTGLFRKQTSQLSLENLEDVTFEQTNLMQTLFNYGTLKAETAGEHSKFQFPFCPRPQKCAVDIIEAHEKFMESYGKGLIRGRSNVEAVSLPDTGSIQRQINQ
jgi:uncharacterized membrane protein YdbT with pleckstrin-like domain